MKMILQLLLFSSFISFLSCERCDDDIVIADFELTDISRSFLPETVSDTLIYTNDSIDIILITEEGKVLQDTITHLINICSVPLTDEQWEVATTEMERVQYFLEEGEFVFEYGIEIREATLESDEELVLDSLNIFENFFLNVNDDKDEFIEWNWAIWMPLNDIQNEYTINTNGNARMIADTILNGNTYLDIIGNNRGRNFFYSQTQGLLAFEYLGDTWYLKQ